MALLEDYSAAARYLEEGLPIPDNFTPTRRRYEWRYGVVDGSPPSERPRFPARLPKPPREPQANAVDDDVQRERTRSPLRRSYNDKHGYHRTANEIGNGNLTTGGNLNAFMPAPQNMSNEQLQALFAVRAHGLRTLLHNKVMAATSPTNPIPEQISKDTWLAGAQDYIAKALPLAARLGIEEADVGEQAWSDEIPASRVWARLSSYLGSTPEPTIAAVEAAFDALDLQAAKAVEKHAGDDTGLGLMPNKAASLPPRQEATSPDASDVAAESITKHVDTEDSLAQPTPVESLGKDREAHQVEVHNKPAQDTRLEQAGAPDTPLHEPNPSLLPDELNEEALATEAALPVTATIDNDETAPRAPTTINTDCEDEDMGIASLFCTPTPPLMPPPLQRRQRRIIPENFVGRRSVRLSKKPVMPAEEKAKRNLCRKLGITDDDTAPIEEVMREFTRTFNGPMAPNIRAAVTAIFDLENETADSIDDALLSHAGQDVTELHAYNDA